MADCFGISVLSGIIFPGKVREQTMANDRVEAVERALTLLDCFSEQRRSLTLAELAEQTGFYKSTILRLMKSLEMFGYIQRDSKGLFSLGSAIRRLSHACDAENSLEPLIRPVLVSLRDASNESASFYVRAGVQRICLYRENAQREMRHHLDEGIRLPLGQGAAGRILRAFSEELAEDEVIRQQGWARSQGERSAEVGAVAVPLFNRGGQFLGTLALSGLITRFGEEQCQQWISLLKQEARKLASQIV
ncbi:IclR family transcriptional regulator [Pokkaliibacter plantistimulans]|uniref:IclR family transcriptional regulator n=2 Tax=Pseudomonadota TaxID=1224 RepID=A0A2S5KQ64_9PROT|nr:IclR family transcriptional regulator [Pokkaliibacter plantistimulans]